MRLFALWFWSRDFFGRVLGVEAGAVKNIIPVAALLFFLPGCRALCRLEFGMMVARIFISLSPTYHSHCAYGERKSSVIGLYFFLTFPK